MTSGARKAWQRTMIALARSQGIKRFMQSHRAGTHLAGQFVAGKEVSDAIEAAKYLADNQGIRSSLFYLGEYVGTRELVAINVRSILAVIQALRETAFDVHVSVDPTQIGLYVDVGLMKDNLAEIVSSLRDAAANRPGAHMLMLDMEDRTTIDTTIAEHDKLKSVGNPVALTLQAYLRRTEADLECQIARGGRVRLVRGAFAAESAHAFQRIDEIKANYRHLVGRMFSPAARQAGFYPIVATHDTALHEYAISAARANGWTPGEYEFEMLLGVRSDVSTALASRGERVRCYVPFGEDWWPYAVRRIGENPSNATLLLRSVLQGGRHDRHCHAAL